MNNILNSILNQLPGLLDTIQMATLLSEQDKQEDDMPMNGFCMAP